MAEEKKEDNVLFSILNTSFIDRESQISFVEKLKQSMAQSDQKVIRYILNDSSNQNG